MYLLLSPNVISTASLYLVVLSREPNGKGFSLNFFKKTVK